MQTKIKLSTIFKVIRVLKWTGEDDYFNRLAKGVRGHIGQSPLGFCNLKTLSTPRSSSKTILGTQMAETLFTVSTRWKFLQNVLLPSKLKL